VAGSGAGEPSLPRAESLHCRPRTPPEERGKGVGRGGWRLSLPTMHGLAAALEAEEQGMGTHHPSLSPPLSAGRPDPATSSSSRWWQRVSSVCGGGAVADSSLARIEVGRRGPHTTVAS